MPATTNPHHRHRQKEDIKRRAIRPPDSRPTRCAAFGCQRLTQRSQGKGLSETHCKQHIEFHRRHGSFWRGSFTRAELHPYRVASRAWLRANREAPQVAAVIRTLDALLAGSGRAESAYSLRGLTAERRARIALARLRVAGVPGERLLETTLTIKAIMADRGPRAAPEFEAVQIAKALHRLASGTRQTTSGFPLPPKYPRPEGHMMRLLGRQVEDIAGIAANGDAVAEVIAMTTLQARDRT